jgi:hypothetical protein
MMCALTSIGRRGSIVLFPFAIFMDIPPWELYRVLMTTAVNVRAILTQKLCGKSVEYASQYNVHPKHLVPVIRSAERLTRE